MILHKSLAGGGWKRLTLPEQMGNIGSEIGRALNREGVDRQNAIYRALELMDLTLADKRWHKRGTEIARAREVVCDFMLGNNSYNSSPDDLERYFMQFAVAARLNR